VESSSTQVASARLSGVTEKTGFLKGKRAQEAIANTIGYILLGVITVTVLIPLAWTVSSSLKAVHEMYAFPPKWIPDKPLWQNYVEAWNYLPFFRFFLNTTLLVVLNSVGQLVSIPLVAYGFARLRFKGRNVMFMLLLSMMMVPWYVQLIPTYIMYKELGWVGTYLPLFVPSFFATNAFVIFLMRQYLMTIPRELDEAARVDGASYLQVLFHVLLPLLKPVITIMLVFTFLDVWNDYLGPLLFLSGRENYTLAIGLAFFRTRIGNLLNYLMAMSVVMLVPPTIIYFLAQRHIIGGIAAVGIKG
jgi:multiple sugar transport system permease protein